MKLKRFEACTLQEALQAVKAELGSDAVIVSTRRLNKNAGLFGLLTQPMVEVTAAVDRAKPREPQGPRVSGKTLPNQPGETRLENAKPWYEPPTSGTPGLVPSFGEHLQVASLLEPVTEQLTTLREEMKAIREKEGYAESVLLPLRQDMETMRSMVQGFLSERMGTRASALPPELRMYFEGLTASGINPELSLGLLKSVAETLGGSGLAHEEMVQDVLRERMEQSLSVSGPLAIPGGLPKVVMLVGPTGVGKTTTVAKLASHFTHGPIKVKTVVMTVDTYRVAAVEQLRVYARILKVPIEVAVTPEDLPSCILRHRDAGLILVDTAGRSPLDPSGQHELAALAKKDVTLETHLVLAAPTDGILLQDIVRRYMALPIHRLLFTKLDETHHIGPLFNLAHHTGLPVSYLTTGQRVPEDLELANPQAIVDRIHLSKRIEAIAAA